MPTLLTIEGDPDYKARLEKAVEHLKNGCKLVWIKLENGEWGAIIDADAQFSEEEFRLVSDPELIKELAATIKSPSSSE